MLKTYTGLMADMQPPSTPYHVVAQRQNILQDATSRLASTLSHESQWQEQRAEELAKLSHMLEQLRQHKSSKSAAATPSVHRHAQVTSNSLYEQPAAHGAQLPAASTWLKASPPTTPRPHIAGPAVVGEVGGRGPAPHAPMPEARILEDANQLFSRFHQELEAELSQLAGHATNAQFTASAMKAHAEEVLARTTMLEYAPGGNSIAGAPAGPGSGSGYSPLAQLSQKFAAAGTRSTSSVTASEGTEWTRRLQALFDEDSSEDGASNAAAGNCPSKFASFQHQDSSCSHKAASGMAEPLDAEAGAPSTEASWGTALGAAAMPATGTAAVAGGAAAASKTTCSARLSQTVSDDLGFDQPVPKSSKSRQPASWQDTMQHMHEPSHQASLQQHGEDANNSPPPMHQAPTASWQDQLHVHPKTLDWEQHAAQNPVDNSSWAEHATQHLGAACQSNNTGSGQQESERSSCGYSSDGGSRAGFRESTADSGSELGSVRAAYTRMHSRVTEAAQQLSSLTKELQALRQAAQHEAAALQATKAQRQEEEERLGQLLSQNQPVHAATVSATHPAGVANGTTHDSSASTHQVARQANALGESAVAVLAMAEAQVSSDLAPVVKPQRVRRRAKRQAVRRSVSCSDIAAVLKAAAGAMQLPPAVAPATASALPTGVNVHEHALWASASHSKCSASPGAGKAASQQQQQADSPTTAVVSTSEQADARAGTHTDVHGQLAEQRQTREQLLQELAMLQAQALEARTQLADISKDQLEAATKVATDQARLASLQTELSQAQAELTSVLGEVSLAREHVQQHTKAAQEAAEQLSSQQTQQQQCQAALDAAAALLADTQAQQDTAAAELAKTSPQLQAVKQQVDDLQEELAKLTATRDMVQHSHQKAAAEFQELQAQHAALQQSVQQLQQQQQALQKEQEPLQHSTQQLQQQVQELEQQQAALRGHIKQLQNEEASHNDTIVALQQEKAGLQQEVNALHAAQTSQAQRLRTQQQALQQQVDELTSQRNQLQHAVQELATEHQDVTHALAAVSSEVTGCLRVLSTVPHAATTGYSLQTSATPGYSTLLAQLQGTPATATPTSIAARPATAAQQLLTTFAAAAAAVMGSRPSDMPNSTASSGNGPSRAASVSSMHHALTFQQELQMSGLQAQLTAVLGTAAASDAAAAEARRRASAAEEECHQQQLQVVRDRAAHAAVVSTLEQVQHERDSLQAALQAAQAARRNAELMLAEKEQLLTAARSKVQELQQQAAGSEQEHTQLQVRLQQMHAELRTAKETVVLPIASCLSRATSCAATQTVAFSQQTSGMDAPLVGHQDAGTQPTCCVQQHKGVQTIRQQMIHSWCQTACLDDDSLASLSSKGTNKMRMVHSWCQTVSSDHEEKASWSLQPKQADVLGSPEDSEAAKSAQLLSTADLALAAATVELERVQTQVVEQQAMLQQLQVEARDATQQLAHAQQQYQDRQQQLVQDAATHLATTRSEQHQCEEALEFAATELAETLTQQQAAAAQLANTRSKQQAATVAVADMLAKQQALQQQLDSLQQDVEALKGERVEVQQRLVQAGRDLQQLQSEHARLQESIQELHDQQHLLQSQAPDQQQVQPLQQQHQELQTSVQELQAQQRQLQELCAERRVEHAGLQQETTALHGSHAELAEQLQVLRKDAVDLQRSRAECKTELDMLMQQVDELLAQRNQLQQAVQELATEHQDVTHALAAVSSEVTGCLYALSSLPSLGASGPSCNATIPASGAMSQTGPAPTSPNNTPAARAPCPISHESSSPAGISSEFEFVPYREISLGGVAPASASTATGSPGKQALQEQVGALQAQVATLMKAAAASKVGTVDLAQVGSAGDAAGKQQQHLLVAQEKATQLAVVNQLEQVQSERDALHDALQIAQAGRRAVELLLVEKEQLLAALTERVDTAVKATHQQQQLVAEQLQQQLLREQAFEVECAQLYEQLRQMQAAAITAQAAAASAASQGRPDQFHQAVSPQAHLSGCSTDSDIGTEMRGNVSGQQAGSGRLMQQHRGVNTDALLSVAASTQTAAITQQTVATSSDAACVRDTGTQPDALPKLSAASTQTDAPTCMHATATQTLAATHAHAGISTDACMVCDQGIQVDISVQAAFGVDEASQAPSRQGTTGAEAAAARADLELIKAQVAEQQAMLQQLQVEARDAEQQLEQAQLQYQERQLQIALLVSAQQQAAEYCTQLTEHNTALRSEMLAELSELRGALWQAGEHWGKQQDTMQCAFAQLQSECEQVNDRRTQLLADAVEAKQMLQRMTEGLRAAVSFWQGLGCLQQACTQLMHECDNAAGSNSNMADGHAVSVLRESCDWVVARVRSLLSLYHMMEKKQEGAAPGSGSAAGNSGSSSTIAQVQDTNGGKAMVSIGVQADALPVDLPDLQQLQSALQSAMGVSTSAVFQTEPSANTSQNNMQAGGEHMHGMPQGVHAATPLLLQHELIAACGELRGSTASLQQRYNFACLALCSLYQHTKKLYLYCQASARLLHSEVMGLASSGHAAHASTAPADSWPSTHAPTSLSQLHSSPSMHVSSYAVVPGSSGQAYQTPSTQQQQQQQDKLDGSTSAAADKCREAWAAFGAQLLRLLKHVAHGVKQCGATTLPHSADEQQSTDDTFNAPELGGACPLRSDATQSQHQQGTHMACSTVDQCIQKVVMLASQLQHSLQPCCTGTECKQGAASSSTWTMETCQGTTAAATPTVSTDGSVSDASDACHPKSQQQPSAIQPQLGACASIAGGSLSNQAVDSHQLGHASLPQQPAQDHGSDALVTQAELDAALQKLGLAVTHAPVATQAAMQGCPSDTQVSSKPGKSIVAGMAPVVVVDQPARQQEPAASVGIQVRGAPAAREGATGHVLLARVQQMRQQLQLQRTVGRSVTSSPRTSVPSTPSSARKVASLSQG